MLSTYWSISRISCCSSISSLPMKQPYRLPYSEHVEYCTEIQKSSQFTRWQIDPFYWGNLNKYRLSRAALFLLLTVSQHLNFRFHTVPTQIEQSSHRWNDKNCWKMTQCLQVLFIKSYIVPLKFDQRTVNSAATFFRLEDWINLKLLSWLPCARIDLNAVFHVLSWLAIEKRFEIMSL